MSQLYTFNYSAASARARGLFFAACVVFFGLGVEGAWFYFSDPSSKAPPVIYASMCSAALLSIAFWYGQRQSELAFRERQTQGRAAMAKQFEQSVGLS